MIDFSPVHGNAYANDPQYDRMTGRVTHRHEIVGMTLDGWKVRHIVEVIDLGRAAAVTPADPDAQLADEFCADFSPHIVNALTSIRENKAERQRRLRDEIVATLREHGPASANTITERLGNGAFARVLDTLRRNPQTFEFVGGQFKVWGLPGQAYTRQVIKLGSKLRNALLEALGAHGPQTARELWERLGGDLTSISKCLLRNNDDFAVVDMRPAMGTVPPTRVWGLRP